MQDVLPDKVPEIDIPGLARAVILQAIKDSLGVAWAGPDEMEDARYCISQGGIDAWSMLAGYDARKLKQASLEIIDRFKSMTPDEKLCPKCLTPKTRDEFHIDRHQKDGHAVICKVCRRAYVSEWEKKTQRWRRK